jgi:hypothetical protein
MTIPTDATDPAPQSQQKAVMPSLLDLDLLPSPLVDPLSYPGAALRHSFLWLDSWVYRVEPASGGGRSGWAVVIDGGPLAVSSAGDRLDDALRGAGVAPMPGRHPVLAFGSNASPAQLLTKFAALSPVRRVVPVLRGAVAGLALGHSPHVSIPGYVPYVIVDGGAAAVLDAFVLWLDPAQRAVLDRTEPNYRLVRMPAERYPLSVETPGGIGEYSAYKGKWGALRWPCEPAPARAGSQQEMFERVGQLPWFAAALGPGDARSWMARLAADADLREWVRDSFAANGMVVGDGWQELISPAG